MKVLLFSDIHGDVRALERLLRQSADVYIAAGDLSTFGRDLDNCAAALGPLGERLWLLPGNHETHDQTRALCERYGFIDFHRQIRALGGTHWAGLGYSNPTPFNTPGEYTEEEIAEALAAFEDLRPLNLVVHFPPHGTTLDQAGPFSRGEHAGSRVLRPPREDHAGRPTAAALDLHFPPRDPLPPAGAKRLEHRLLSGESGRQMPRRERMATKPLPFRRCEETIKKPTSVPCHRPLKSIDPNEVGPNPDHHDLPSRTR